MENDPMSKARKRSENRILQLIGMMSERQPEELKVVFEKTMHSVNRDAYQAAKLLSVQCAAQMVLIGELNREIDDLKGIQDAK